METKYIIWTSICNTLKAKTSNEFANGKESRNLWSNWGKWLGAKFSLFVKNTETKGLSVYSNTTEQRLTSYRWRTIR